MYVCLAKPVERKASRNSMIFAPTRGPHVALFICFLLYVGVRQRYCETSARRRVGVMVDYLYFNSIYYQEEDGSPVEFESLPKELQRRRTRSFGTPLW